MALLAHLRKFRTIPIAAPVFSGNAERRAYLDSRDAARAHSFSEQPKLAAKIVVAPIGVNHILGLFINHRASIGSKVYQEYYSTNIGLPTTVKLEEKDKRKLEQLQALVTLKTGKRKITQQQLLSTLITQALNNGDAFLNDVLKETVPISDADFEKIISLGQDWGIATKWRDVDKTVYGAQKKR